MVKGAGSSLFSGCGARLVLFVGRLMGDVLQRVKHRISSYDWHLSWLFRTCWYFCRLLQQVPQCWVHFLMLTQLLLLIFVIRRFLVGTRLVSGGLRCSVCCIFVPPKLSHSTVEQTKQRQPPRKSVKVATTRLWRSAQRFELQYQTYFLKP